MSSNQPEEELPSSFCLYCNIKLPKYTCPNCHARTCSVACVKRHKVLRQCTGVRDPTTYVKRSRLATASGVNRDYNFLTSLEREITAPNFLRDENAEEQNTNDPKTLQHWLKNRQIVVKNAPWKGFSRAQKNKTCISGPKKKRQIHWTVEWILADSHDTPRLDEQVPERRALSESYFCYGNLPDNQPIKRENKNKERTGFYLVLQTPANVKKCAKLIPEQSLMENLKGRVVLEFPSIIVTTKPGGPEDWQVVEDRKIVELPEPRNQPQETLGKSDVDDRMEDLEYIQRHIIE